MRKLFLIFSVLLTFVSYSQEPYYISYENDLISFIHGLTFNIEGNSNNVIKLDLPNTGKKYEMTVYSGKELIIKVSYANFKQNKEKLLKRYISKLEEFENGHYEIDLKKEFVCFYKYKGQLIIYNTGSSIDDGEHLIEFWSNEKMYKTFKIEIEGDNMKILK